MKDLCQKWKVKLIFRGACAQAARNRDCWVFGNHWHRV